MKVKMNNQVVTFLNIVCVKHGFTLTDLERKAIASQGSYDASELARVILIQEGLDPDNEIRLFREVRNAYLTFLELNSTRQP